MEKKTFEEFKSSWKYVQRDASDIKKFSILYLFLFLLL